ncbi:hypothetical protein [Paraflavitalea sp. CAU 1676]|uniref:hypothetical protein n=1 Tax=Paraflavitalea sp. CAU 1676 TaxID=3032598 RepID=UPI0023DCD059|nr:hypothetical protein [Paraflavitalea sp. CAU 1676]MDF2191249.1 hypothetical protein [Paraflavitalea sp. CAU 1676]
MKKLVVLASIMISCFMGDRITAQIRLSLPGNTGDQPVWGPAGYDHANYYYMPDIDAFYYVPKRTYIYRHRGRWIFTTDFPKQFQHYDRFSGYKVVINDPKPYRNAKMYRAKFAGYKGRTDQPSLSKSDNR